MGIDRKSVDHVARLARLALTDEEREQMSAELADILQHAENIQGLDLDDIEPTAHALPLRNVMRADEVVSPLSQSEALSGAPEVEDGRFKVPRIIEDA